MDSNLAAMILSDDLLVDTDWVQELHSPDHDGEAGHAHHHAQGSHSLAARVADHQDPLLGPTGAGGGVGGAADPPIPSGAVLSQRLRAMPKATLPLPWSADDINPAPWRRTTTEWLPGSFMPEHPPEPALPWPPAALNPETAAAVAAAKTRPLDLRSLSQAKLLAASRKHNAGFNIFDPIGAVLDGVRENAALSNPDRACLPFTLGGNPSKNEYSRAWALVMKNGPGPALDDGRKQQTSRPAPTTALRQPSTDLLARTTSNAAAGTSSAAAAAPPAPPAAAPAPGPALKVAYGTLTEEQLRFTGLLSSFLEVPVKLPLLAPGAQALDLRRLYMEVNGLGGFSTACATNAWPQLASSLQNDSSLAGILKQVYAYYLLPVEEVMPTGAARNARLVEVLEARVRENEALPLLRSNVHVRPTAPNVKKALTTCSEGLKKWGTHCPAAVVQAANAALAVRRRKGAISSQGQGQEKGKEEGWNPGARAKGSPGGKAEAGAGGSVTRPGDDQGQQQQQQQQQQQEEEAGNSTAVQQQGAGRGAAEQQVGTGKGAAVQHEGAGKGAAEQQAQAMREAGPSCEPPSVSPAVAAAPVLAVRLLRQAARSLLHCCDERRPVQLYLESCAGAEQAAAAAAAAGAAVGVAVAAAAGTAAAAPGAAAAAAAAAGVEGNAAKANSERGLGQEQAGPSSLPLAAGDGEGAVRFTWSEAQPLVALLQSYRQLKAGPPILRRPAPRLKEHYLAQLRPGGSAGGAPEMGSAGAGGVVHEEEANGVEEQRPAPGKRGVTPRCGDCRTCNNLALKKACDTNRARMSAGQEPIFLTAQAKQVYLAKRARYD